jgi:hypothetical protein
MPFPARGARSPSAADDSGPVFSVGRQVFINCPGGREDRASLVDEKGAVVVGTLIDGAEVEIVAWVPRRSATRYLVRSTRNELTGWIGAGQLRATRMPRLPESPAKPASGASWIAPRSPAKAPRR